MTDHPHPDPRGEPDADGLYRTELLGERLPAPSFPEAPVPPRSTGNGPAPTSRIAADEGSGDEVELPPGLSMPEFRALRVLASNGTHAQAAAAMNRQAKTVQRLLQRPEAQDALRVLEAEMLRESEWAFMNAPKEVAQLARDIIAGQIEGSPVAAGRLLMYGWREVHVAGRQARDMADLQNQVRDLRDIAERVAHDAEGDPQ